MPTSLFVWKIISRIQNIIMIRELLNKTLLQFCCSSLVFQFTHKRAVFITSKLKKTFNRAQKKKMEWSGKKINCKHAVYYCHRMFNIDTSNKIKCRRGSVLFVRQAVLEHYAFDVYINQYCTPLVAIQGESEAV